MRLWVDATRPAPKGFATWAKTAWEAIDALKTGKYNYISLDYNLGNMKDNGDGYMVACWIERQAIERKMERMIWNCHAYDNHGRNMIESALNSANAVWDKFI